MPFKPIDFRKTQISCCAEIDEELYLRIFTGAGVAEDNELNRLSRRLEEATDEETKEWICDQASDLNYYKKELAQWAGYLSAIAIYSRIEIARARMVAIATGTKKDCHRIKEFEKAISVNPFNLDHKTIIEYGKINELRIINNNIKHHGPKVGSELAKLPGYKEGNTLAIDFDKWRSFVISGQLYLKDLASKIKSCLKPLPVAGSK